MSIFFKIFLITIISFNIYANEIVFDELTFSAGMVNTSWAESEKTFEGDNISEPESGTSSNIVGDIHYKFSSVKKMAYFVHATFPLIEDASSTYMSGGAGIEFYFSDLSSKIAMEYDGTTIQFLPKFRYFWGVFVDGASLIYTTEEEKKSDILVEIGALAGATYSMNDKYTFRAVLSAAKSAGIVTSGISTRFLLGGTIFLDLF